MWRGRNKGRWVTNVNSREPILGSSPTVPSVMINKHSLGEMSPSVVHNYIEIIKKTSKIFFHINQSYFKRRFDKNNFNLLSHEYGFENDKDFKLTLKYLDFCHFNFDNFQNYNMDLFFHIYKKIKND